MEPTSARSNEICPRSSNKSSGGSRYTVSAQDHTEDEFSGIESTIAERNPSLINRPVTAFYTQRDGAVDWKACIDNINPDVHNIEVESSHLGITLDPDVWLEIAKRLAQQRTSPRRRTAGASAFAGVPGHPVNEQLLRRPPV